MNAAQRHHQGSYTRFGGELAVDFIIMYLVMYTMIASLGHLRLNLNNVYMTLMMVAPMALVMLWTMRSMFESRRLNIGITVAAISIFVASFAAMRTQTGIGNAEFLRAMIPHHSGAILMCKQAPITDPDVRALCQQIVASQRKEIAQMEQILERY